MNETTLYLAQLVGPIYLVLGLGLLVGGKYYAKVYDNLGKDVMAYLLAGMASMAIGLAMVLAHNLWGTLLEILVSLFGWAALVKGVLILLVPKSFTDLAKSLFSPAFLTFGGLVAVVWGGYMSYMAYFV